MWVAGGLVLAAVELATPGGFFIIFFGLGAVTVGVLTRFDVTTTWWTQWLLFTVLSVIYLLLFRNRLLARFQNPPASTVDSFVGALAIAKDAVQPGAVGRVEVRGSSWSARNTSALTLEVGQRCRIVSVDGLLLAVVPE
jgi:inner membrane protein